MVRLAGLRGRFPAGLAALAAVLAALAGCATAPSGGPPRPAPGANSQVQAYVQPLPPPSPTKNWTPDEVVLGFLHASASYAFDPAAARQYLVPQLRRSWHPGGGVAVVGLPKVVPLPYNPKLSLGSGQSVPQRVVHLTGPQVATLSQSGQYEYAPSNVNIRFLLEQNASGVWLIENPPRQTLMLTESDFEWVYQPRNLFFFAHALGSQSPSVLVPDPVYAPTQSSNSALNTDLATGLVNGLLKGQGGWLSDATTSAFPAGTRLLQKVTISGKTAQVDLGGAAASHSQQWMLMADQLAETLGDETYALPHGTYALPLATSVQLSINHHAEFTIGAPELVPPVSSAPIQLITGTSTVGQLPAQPGRGDKPQARLGQDQLGQVTVTAVAESPDPDHQLAVAIKYGGGCAVDEQSGGQGKSTPYPLTGSGGPCSTLSYDTNGNLWAVAAGGVWVLQPNHAPVAVDLSAMSAALQPGDQITALRMAPDAVRAALLVRSATGNRLLLAAVHIQGGSAAFGPPVTVGTGLTDDPVAISWYNAYNLAVLGTVGIYEVPLTTGAGQQPPQLISPLPTGAQALTLTTDGTDLVVGTSQSVYVEPAAQPGSWAPAENGTNPVYPG